MPTQLQAARKYLLHRSRSKEHMMLLVPLRPGFSQACLLQILPYSSLPWGILPLFKLDATEALPWQAVWDWVMISACRGSPAAYPNTQYRTRWCVKEGWFWAFSCVCCLIHICWSRAEPALCTLSAAAIGLFHLVELLCVLSHTGPRCEEGEGLHKQLLWAENGIMKVPHLAKSLEIAV